MDGWAILDGVLAPLDETRLPVTDPALTVGWSVFETLGVQDGEPNRLDAHLRRLFTSCDGAEIPCPDEARLRAQVAELVAVAPAEARVRITVTGGGRCLLTAVPMPVGRAGKPVRAVRGAHRDEPFLAGRIKHSSRAPWVVAVRRSGADEVLLVDENGRFTEGTTSAIVAVVDGVIWTAPDDGRILASTTLAGLLKRAEALRIPVRRRGAPAVGPWDGLYIASATRRLAPVVALDDEALPGWEPVGRRLFDDLEW